MEKESSLFKTAQIVVILLVAVLFNGPSVQAALVVPNYSGSSITFYNNSDNGNLAPWKTIAGSNTGLNGPTCSFVYNEEVYVANHNDGKVHVFSYGAEGNVAPIRTIEGSATALVNPTHCIVVNDELFLSNFRGDVLVFNATDSGNPAPKRQITSVNNNRGLTVSGNEIFVARDVGSGVNTIYVFNTSDDGPATPKRTLEGANTQISFPLGMSVYNGELFVGSVNNNAILVFNVTDSGDARPKRIISGANTQINYPAGVWAWGGETFVANHHGNTINVFNSTDNGNTAPKRIISGASTGLNNPYFVAVYSCVQPPSGLVSWWGGDNNALDMVGGNHGLPNGATFAAGQVGQAFSFDGTNDYVNVSDSASLQAITNQFSIEAWVRPSNLPSGDPYYDAAIIEREDYVQGFALATKGNAFGLWIGNGSGTGVMATSNTVSINNWYHVVGTYDGSDARIYVNGNLENTQPVSMVKRDKDISIGSSRGGLRFFAGLIDEAAIYNRTLTAPEIVAIYNAGSAGKCIPDRSPKPFAFVDQTGVDPNTAIPSNTITVEEIDYAAPIAITACTSSLCEYSINGGDFTTAAGTVNNGNLVTLRQTSSSGFSTPTDLTLTIGGVSDTFSVTTRARSADLAITKTSAPVTPIVGQPLTYTLTVTNAGPDEAPNVSVSDVLPQSLTYQSASSGCQENSGTVTCNLGSIDIGAQKSVEIVVIPSVPGPVSNTAGASSSVDDPNTANNTSDPDQTTVFAHLYLPLILRN